MSDGQINWTMVGAIAGIVGVIVAVIALANAGGGSGGGGTTTTTAADPVPSQPTSPTTPAPKTIPEPKPKRPPPAKLVACAPGPGPKHGYESNEVAGLAAGPVLANRPLKQGISSGNDLDYYAICLTRRADLTFSVSCTGSDNNLGCGDLYGQFTPDAGIPKNFTGTPSSPPCSVPPGRYLILIQDLHPTASYALTVQTDKPAAVAAKVPPEMTWGNPDKAC